MLFFKFHKLHTAIKKNLLTYFVFVLITIISYLGLVNSFYQQDEWHAVGRIMVQGPSYIYSEIPLLGNILLESRPFARSLNLIFFGYFALNTFPLFLFVVFTHSLNSLLVYFITIRLTKKKFVSFLAVLFFVLNDTSKQAVLWYGSVTGTLLSTTGIVLAVLFYLKYLDKREKRYVSFSLFSLVLSLGFKETGYFLFFLLPVLDFTYEYYKNRKIRFCKTPILILFIGIVLVSVKFVNIFFIAKEYSGYVGSHSEGALTRLIWAGVTYPIETFSQAFIPDRIFYPFSQKLTYVIFPYFESVNASVQVSEKVVLELLSLFAGFIIVALVLSVLIKRKNKFPLVFSTLFYLLGFLPFIFIIKSSAYLESRYYYSLIIPIVFFLAMFFEGVFGIFKKIKNRNIARFLLITGTCVYIALLALHTKYIHYQLELQTEKAQLQKPILASLYSIHPLLSKKQVFYIDSNRDFVVEGNPLPFQQGVGYTILVYYLAHGADPSFKQFLADNYFWEIENTGYKEKSGYGFGFYSDLKSLKKGIKKNKLNVNAVEAFYYDSKSAKMKNISREVRAEIIYE